MVRAPDFAHTAFPNQGGDFIGTEAATGADGHVRAFYGKSRGGTRLGSKLKNRCGILVEGYRQSPIPW